MHKVIHSCKDKFSLGTNFIIRFHVKFDFSGTPIDLFMRFFYNSISWIS